MQAGLATENNKLPTRLLMASITIESPSITSRLAIEFCCPRTKIRGRASARRYGAEGFEIRGRPRPSARSRVEVNGIFAFVYYGGRSGGGGRCSSSCDRDTATRARVGPSGTDENIYNTT